MNAKKHDSDTLDFLFDYGIDLVGRAIHLTGELAVQAAGEGVSVRPVEMTLRALSHMDKADGEITVWVTTNGGGLSEMFALYDRIRACRNVVRTIALGEVCSAGALVLVAGDERYASPNAWFMSHAESGQSDQAPTIWDQEARTKVLIRMEDRFAKLMAERTKRNFNWWRDVHKTGPRELWLSAAQMCQYGIVHEVGIPE